ncbi:MAG: ribonuclease H-like domain-containing protein [Sandaracinaceae bacterium]|nr:ribonuclease H-like domain-containing protein [Sandaracinaceae bacterium]
MSSLRTRLGRLTVPTAGGVPAPVPEPALPEAPPAPEALGQGVRGDLDRMRTRGRARRSAPGWEHVARGPRVHELPGATHLTEHGELHVVEHRCALEQQHGARAIKAARTVDADVVATLALDPQMRGLDFSRALYIDTETTGLMGGTGTVPFLIGTAAFEGEQLVVRKLMLRRLGEEAPMLHALAEQLREASCVVSFNGKSFDWPLLRTRFVMNRVKAPPVPPHLDLLHCARRVFKGRMERVRLVDIEREVLGFQRVDDVAGSEIPGLYMAYLRGGDAAPIARIIEHNRLDLIALAALLAELVGQFAGLGAEEDPRDKLACARVAERAGDGGLARALASAAVLTHGQGANAAEAWLLHARVARREGDVDREEQALLSAVLSLEGSPDGAGQATPLTHAHVHLALAKLYERKRKDPERALPHARLTVPAEDEDQAARRLARLTRRV